MAEPGAAGVGSPGLICAFRLLTFPRRLSPLPPSSLTPFRFLFSDPLISRSFGVFLPSSRRPLEPYFPFHLNPAPELWRGIAHLSIPSRAASPRPRAARAAGHPRSTRTPEATRGVREGGGLSTGGMRLPGDP